MTDKQVLYRLGSTHVSTFGYRVDGIGQILAFYAKGLDSSGAVGNQPLGYLYEKLDPEVKLSSILFGRCDPSFTEENVYEDVVNEGRKLAFLLNPSTRLAEALASLGIIYLSEADMRWKFPRGNWTDWFVADIALWSPILDKLEADEEKTICFNFSYEGVNHRGEDGWRSAILHREALIELATKHIRSTLLQAAVWAMSEGTFSVAEEETAEPAKEEEVEVTLSHVTISRAIGLRYAGRYPSASDAPALVMLPGANRQIVFSLSSVREAFSDPRGLCNERIFRQVLRAGIIVDFLSNALYDVEELVKAEGAVVDDPEAGVKDVFVLDCASSEDELHNNMVGVITELARVRPRGATLDDPPDGIIRSDDPVPEDFYEEWTSGSTPRKALADFTSLLRDDWAEKEQPCGYVDSSLVEAALSRQALWYSDEPITREMCEDPRDWDEMLRRNETRKSGDYISFWFSIEFKMVYLTAEAYRAWRLGEVVFGNFPTFTVEEAESIYEQRSGEAELADRAEGEE
jgi:hypothetical protein